MTTRKSPAPAADDATQLWNQWLEQQQASSAALQRFAKVDRSSGLLGRGIVRFDLRIPGKMIVRLPRSPGEPIAGDTPPPAG